MSKKELSIKKSKIKVALLFLLVKLSLDLAYVFVISPIYAYSGFTTSINFFALFESYVLVIIIGLCIPRTVDRPSHFLVWMLGIGTIVPALSYYAMHSGNRNFMYAMVLSFLMIAAFCKFPQGKFPVLKEGKTIGITTVLMIVGIVAASLIVKGGLSHFNLDLSKVYAHRRAVGTLINTGYWAYVNTWVFKVLNPALIGWALWQRRYGLFSFFIGLQVVFFGISAHKSVLFYPVLIVMLYLFMSRRRVLEYLTGGIILVVVLSALISLSFDYHWLSSLFIRRVFFVPAHLNFAYYELFSSIGHVFLSNSILSGWVNYPFPYPPPIMISEYLLGHTNTWANTGFLATAYMHFGYVGMLLFSFIVGFLLWAVDWLVYKRIPLWLGISIIMIPFYSLFSSADLFTSLLTHGILVGFIILLIIGNKQITSGSNNTMGGLYGKNMPS